MNFGQLIDILTRSLGLLIAAQAFAAFVNIPFDYFALGQQASAQLGNFLTIRLPVLIYLCVGLLLLFKGGRLVRGFVSEEAVARECAIGIPGPGWYAASLCLLGILMAVNACFSLIHRAAWHFTLWRDAQQSDSGALSPWIDLESDAFRTIAIFLQFGLGLALLSFGPKWGARLYARQQTILTRQPPSQSP